MHHAGDASSAAATSPPFIDTAVIAIDQRPSTHMTDATRIHTDPDPAVIDVAASESDDGVMQSAESSSSRSGSSSSSSQHPSSSSSSSKLNLTSSAALSLALSVSNNNNNSEDDENKEDEDNDEDEGMDERRLPSCTSLSIAQRFHHDGIHSIFRFLTMSELNHAAQACKQWLSAATDPSFRLSSTVHVRATLERLRAVIASPLRNHISKLTMAERMTSISQLRSLHVLRHLPYLEIIVNISSIECISQQPIMLPPKLDHLVLTTRAVKDEPLCPSDAHMRGVQQLLINAAAAVSALTYLWLHLSDRDVELDCTHLINLVNLTDLTIV